MAAAPRTSTRPAASDPDPVTKVLEVVGEQKLPKNNNQGGNGGNEGGGEGIGTPGPASAKPVVRKVKKVAQDLLH